MPELGPWGDPSCEPVIAPGHARLRLVTFNPFRALEVPGASYVKPELMFDRRREIEEADGLLFPETWQVAALVHGFRRPIFPSSASYQIGRDKIEMTRVFQAATPENVPATVIAPSTDEGVERVLDELGLPVVIKDPRSTRGLGVHLAASRRDVARLGSEIGVLYAQELLESDRTLRVVVVGDSILTAYWRIGGDGLRHNVARGGRIELTGIPPEALRIVETLAREAGIDHAGFDLMVVRGRPYLLELNVFFGTEGCAAAGQPPGPAVRDWVQRSWSPARWPEPQLPCAV